MMVSGMTDDIIFQKSHPWVNSKKGCILSLNSAKIFGCSKSGESTNVTLLPRVLFFSLLILDFRCSMHKLQEGALQ